jgi:UDP-N-acetylglucosamine 2-epimerase
LVLQVRNKRVLIVTGQQPEWIGVGNVWNDLEEVTSVDNFPTYRKTFVTSQNTHLDIVYIHLGGVAGPFSNAMQRVTTKEKPDFVMIPGKFRCFLN